MAKGSSHSELADLQALNLELLRKIENLAQENSLLSENNARAERYRYFFEHNLAGLYATNLGGKILMSNQRFLDLFGFKSQEDAANTAASALFLNPDDRQVLLSLLTSGEAAYNLEFRMCRQDRSTFWALINSMVDSHGTIIGSIIDITRLKEASHALEESEKSYRNLFNYINDAIYILDEHGTFLNVNKGAEKMYGYTREEISGQTPAFLSAPGMNDLSGTLDLIEKAFEGDVQVFEWWGRRKNGEIFPKEISQTAGTYFGKNVVIATGRDITERKRQEDAIRLINESIINYLEFPFATIDYQLITDDICKLTGACLAYLTLHQADGVHYIPKAISGDFPRIEEARKVLGKSLLGKTLRMDPLTIRAISERTALRKGELAFPPAWKIPGDIREKVSEILAVQEYIVFSIAHKDRVLGSFNLMFNADNRAKNLDLAEIFVNQVSSVFLRHQIEESIRAEQNLFVSGPVVVVNRHFSPDFGIQYVSPNIAGIYGYSQEFFNEKPRKYLDLVHPGDRKHFRDIVSQNESAEKDVFELEYRIISRDGAGRWVNDFAVIVRDEKGQAKYIRAYLMDINARKEAERQLKQYSEGLHALNITKDKFFSIIAHDLKNPFQSIMGFAGLLSQEYENYTDEERKSFIENIRESSEHTFKLLQNLLEWARTQTGRIEYNPGYNDVSITANETLLLFKSQADDKNIKLFSEIGYNSMAVYDENMVKTVFRNLISNAIKFSWPGSQVNLSASHLEKNGRLFLEIMVSDHGCGISHEDIPRLFRLDEKFVTEGTAGEKGTGLGLMLCRELIKQNGGELWVESKTGKGSCFHFILPRNLRQHDK
ncbi:MAG TPA: PAS domain S-box protein [Bacteroidales bacterium]|nr:PAS domain S-box protein [Bacteroidales bacterium]HSA44365.1 PAS domain S-box protein [Bacteroidales bacterium]